MKQNIWGFTFDPETGHVYDTQGREQPYTFQAAAITGPDGTVYPANPIEFATRETAEAVFAYLKSLRPDLELTLVGGARTAGMFVCPVTEYSIETPNGALMNAGLVANTIMRRGKGADGPLLSELERCSRKRS